MINQSKKNSSWTVLKVDLIVSSETSVKTISLHRITSQKSEGCMKCHTHFVMSKLYTESGDQIKRNEMGGACSTCGKS
jgi:hypothetical protein